MKNDGLKELLEALSENISDEELLLSVIQADIAATITSTRIAQEISQNDLANALGVSQGLVSRWEHGDANFTLQTLVRIALKLGINMRSPYVPDRHPYTSKGNVISINQNVGGISYASSSPVWGSSKATIDDELKEM